jgi:hypothetical protein
VSIPKLTHPSLGTGLELLFSEIVIFFNKWSYEIKWQKSPLYSQHFLSAQCFHVVDWDVISIIGIAFHPSRSTALSKLLHTSMYLQDRSNHQSHTYFYLKKNITTISSIYKDLHVYNSPQNLILQHISCPRTMTSVVFGCFNKLEDKITCTQVCADIKVTGLCIKSPNGVGYHSIFSASLILYHTGYGHTYTALHNFEMQKFSIQKPPIGYLYLRIRNSRPEAIPMVCNVVVVSIDHVSSWQKPP